PRLRGIDPLEEEPGGPGGDADPVVGELSRGAGDLVAERGARLGELGVRWLLTAAHRRRGGDAGRRQGHEREAPRRSAWITQGGRFRGGRSGGGSRPTSGGPRWALSTGQRYQSHCTEPSRSDSS